MLSLEDSRVFLLIVTFRLVNAFSIATFFQPDEFFQSLEPALNILGYNGWVTWEWREGLRSAAHPLIFSAVYKLVDICANVLSLSTASKAGLMLLAPKSTQALFAAVGDLFTFKLAGRIFGGQAGKDALLLSLGSAFHWFCSTRTFTNSLETSITAVALYYWPWDERNVTASQDSKLKSISKPSESVKPGPKGDVRKSLALAAIACVFRPTNVLVWLFLGLFLMTETKTTTQRAMLVLNAATIGAVIVGLTICADRWYYGEYVFPPYQFVRFNVVQSLSHFYGVNPWHYYLSQGIPLLLISYLPLAIYSMQISLQSPWPSFSKQISLMISGVVPIFSLIGHKEMRFIYPLLPAFHCLVAGVGFPNVPSSWRRSRLLLGLFAVNLPVALYLSQWHQRGVMDVTNWLRREDISSAAAPSSPDRVGFLMPCHSTPWYSHMQGAVDVPNDSSGRVVSGAWALTCEPPTGLSAVERKSYLDEADQFYLDQTKFLQENFPPVPMIDDNTYHLHDRKTKYNWPDKLVAFEAAEAMLTDYLKINNGGRYTECKRFFNSHFHDDHRRKGDVIVWCIQ